MKPKTVNVRILNCQNLAFSFSAGCPSGADWSGPAPRKGHQVLSAVSGPSVAGERGTSQPHCNSGGGGGPVNLTVIHRRLGPVSLTVMP